jgi:hypothetical protein
MSQMIAILSMLHEPPGTHSANRLYHGEPVLGWTLKNLANVRGIGEIFILCWDDQSPAVAEVNRVGNCNIACKGRRQSVQHLDAVAAAGRWMDGWRGGLLQICDFDLGFHGKWIAELAGDRDVLLIDPAAGLIQPELVQRIVDRAEKRADLDMIFSQAAPGLSGVVVKNSLLVQLAAANQHPGKLLHYLPERPSRDPIAGEACVETPVELARTTRQFKLNSRRQIEWMENLDGEITLREIVKCASAKPQTVLPREMNLELTTRRSTFPAFGAAKHFPFNRADFTLESAKHLFGELAEIDDLRLTLGGVGDPLCHPGFFEIVEQARMAGISAIHVETDLYDLDSAQVAGLVEAGIDIISINLPAACVATYQKLMGIDGYDTVLQNIKQLIIRRQSLTRGTPIIVPTFAKCRQNFAEMETWYDQWIRALGTAVITGPGSCDPEMSLTDVAPPRRKACARLDRRMMILSDGRFVSCEQDVMGRQVLGQVGFTSVSEVWNQSAALLRDNHRDGKWELHPVCASCKEWHRP